MSNHPFGFNPGRGDDDDGSDTGGAAGAANDPFAALFGGGDPGDIGAAFQKLGQLLSWQGGPVNWDLARDLSRQAVSAAGDHSVSAAERDEVLDAMRLAELWLDPVNAFAAGVTSANAWSRAEWVEQTLPAWRELVDPVAGRVVNAMTALLQGEGGPMGDLGGLGALGGLGQFPEHQLQALTGPGGPLQQMMASLGGAMFGAQIGQAIGGLAVEVVGSTDIGLPLTPTGRAALLPANIAAFGEGIEVPADQVRLYLALREAAHQRLFAHVPWLRAHLVDAVGAYARGITVDTAQLEEAMGRIDPTNPEALQEALTGGLFEPQNTPEQRASLARLETALALVEGWVDEVVDAAATAHLPAAAALRETVRRRRASGGPAEQTFASLVGLELRPRRSREAAALWGAVLDAYGMVRRDAIWAHPDLMPTAEDLDHPELFTAGLDDAGPPLDLSGLDDPALPSAPPESGE
ncbi:MAG: zinc-dependent metalloprotease [Sporichthyaceae bacterium]